MLQVACTRKADDIVVNLRVEQAKNKCPPLINELLFGPGIVLNFLCFQYPVTHPPTKAARTTPTATRSEDMKKKGGQILPVVFTPLPSTYKRMLTRSIGIIVPSPLGQKV